MNEDGIRVYNQKDVKKEIDGDYRLRDGDETRDKFFGYAPSNPNKLTDKQMMEKAGFSGADSDKLLVTFSNGSALFKAHKKGENIVLTDVTLTPPNAGGYLGIAAAGEFHPLAAPITLPIDKKGFSLLSASQPPTHLPADTKEALHAAVLREKAPKEYEAVARNAYEITTQNRLLNSEQLGGYKPLPTDAAYYNLTPQEQTAQNLVNYKSAQEVATKKLRDKIAEVMPYLTGAEQDALSKRAVKEGEARAEKESTAEHGVDKKGAQNAARQAHPYALGLDENVLAAGKSILAASRNTMVNVSPENDKTPNAPENSGVRGIV